MGRWQAGDSKQKALGAKLSCNVVGKQTKLQ